LEPVERLLSISLHNEDVAIVEPAIQLAKAVGAAFEFDGAIDAE
jgi:hypothetical protein